MPITKLFTGRTPIREVVPEILPRNGTTPESLRLEPPDASADIVEVDEDNGLAAEVERLDQVRREAEAEEARARARAEAARAEVAREEARLAELKEEAARLEQVLTAQAHDEVTRQKAPAAATVTTDPPEPDPDSEPEPLEMPAADPTCKIEFWRGYRKAAFYARTVDGGEELAVAESPMFRARGNGVPDRTDEAAAAYAALVERLEAEGWRRVSHGADWFDATFARDS